jgi:hypothetical protein
MAERGLFSAACSADDFRLHHCMQQPGAVQHAFFSGRFSEISAFAVRMHGRLPLAHSLANCS